MALLLASNNPGKLREVRALFADVEVVAPAALGLDLDVEESGQTFAANAQLKARAYAAASGQIALADDSGLEVDALGGAPGIYSARYGGPDLDDAGRCQLLLAQLAPYPEPAQRQARFRCVLCAVSPDGRQCRAEGTCEGLIAPALAGTNGFWLRSGLFCSRLRQNYGPARPAGKKTALVTAPKRWRPCARSSPAPSQNSASEMWGPFAQYVRPYRSRILLGALCIGLGQAATARIPMLVGDAVDAVLASETAAEQVETYVFYVLTYALGVAVCGYAMRMFLGRTANRIEYDIRIAYFAHLLKLPLSYYQQGRTGDLMARATNDLHSVHLFWIYGVRGIVDTALGLTFTLACMCLLDWKLALLVLVPLPLFSVVMIRIAAVINTRYKAIQDYFGRISTFIQENLSGIRVVKAYTQEPAQNAAFDQLNLAYLEKNRAYIRTRANYRPLSYVIASLCLGLNLWLGGRAVIDGELSLGAFVAFNAYLTQLIRPIMYIGWVIDRAQRALVSMQRINEILAVEPEIQDRALPPANPRPIAGHIAFRKLNFSYGEEQVLHQIDLEIPQGTTLGIIGRVGSGKTTLARLMPRLIQAGPGQLLIDGVPIEEWPLATLRDAIGYVPQNPFLFSNTLSANLAYGADSAAEAQIHSAAEEAQLKKDIDQFDEGFDTLIGERGVTLSGGQKQRATLARALIRRPQILILDDALSAVDTHTEEAILDHLHALMQGRTTLIIAHRISTLRHADRIAVLEDGRIAELGTHAELVNSGGFYAELYQHQQLSAELETL